MGQADAVVCSPPYAELLHERRVGRGPGQTSCRNRSKRGERYTDRGATSVPDYGTAEGQVGALRAGPCPGGEAEVGDVETLTWEKCYSARWQGPPPLLTPESMSHPAKFSLALLMRLYDHGFARGWWRKGDLVVDPFGGVACGGIIAAYKRLRWLGVELEPRFVAMAQDNIALHHRRFVAGGDPVPVCLLGDSRRFSEIVSGVAGIVTSPQGGDVEPQNDKDFRAPHDSTGNLRGSYGTTPGQLGALPAGNADSVITSPPYAAQVVRPGGRDVDNLADVPVTAEQHWGRTGPAQGHYLDAYGTTPGNVGALPAGDADGVVTSPPYEGCEVADLPRSKADGNITGGIGAGYRQGERGKNARKKADGTLTESYGTAPGQVGALRQETYWDAVRCIYGQAYLALRPGGVACVVVKAFVRRGRLVDLPGQTWRLLLSLGFLPVERVRCLLSEETREPSLFGGDEVKKTSRVSFFRRLAEKKGAPVIDAEEILAVRRP